MMRPCLCLLVATYKRETCIPVSTSNQLESEKGVFKASRTGLHAYVRKYVFQRRQFSIMKSKIIF